MNEYGKALFLDDNADIKIYKSNSIHQLYQGKIAGQSVLLVLKPIGENDIIAEYVYLKYGKGILLEGEISNNHLSLTEMNDEYDEIATIEANIQSNTIIGSWKSIGNKKSYTIKLNKI